VDDDNGFLEGEEGAQLREVTDQVVEYLLLFPRATGNLIGFFGQVCPSLLRLLTSSHFCQRDLYSLPKKLQYL
jgi:hypothetical protein